MKCFSDALNQSLLDQQAFTFAHQLMGHPALSLANLAETLPALPGGQVFYSSGLLSEKDDFDRAHLDRPNGLSLEATIENIRTSNSYIMVRKPEAHASFQPVFEDLLADVRTLCQSTGMANSVVDPMLYLFIASPNSITPFHIDRYSTFLMQFQGSKEVCVFPPWDERVASSEICESFMAYGGKRPVWRDEIAPLGHTFQFKPGEALHIPFMAGHHVKNGPDEVSISMSIIFNSSKTAQQSRAMRMNHWMRPALGRIGLAPTPVGRDGLRDAMKASAWQGCYRAARMAGLLRAKQGNQ
jgi:hypothetical protein